MAHATRTPDDENRLRELTESWAAAARNKAIDAVMRHDASDVVVFDVMPPRFVKGADAYRRHWQDWCDALEGPADSLFVQLHLEVGSDVAYCFSVNRLRALPRWRPPRCANARHGVHLQARRTLADCA